MNTPIVVQICQFAPRFKLDPSRLNQPSISLNPHLNDVQECLRTLEISEGSFSECFSMICNFSTHETDFKNSFYTEFSAVINGLGIYLIDYREGIFTALVQFPQLIHLLNS